MTILKTESLKIKTEANTNHFVHLKIVAFILIVSSVFAFIIWLFNQQSSLNDVWNNYDTDKHELISFCEKTEWSKVVRQPVNTFSNIVYFITAIIILKNTLTEKRCNITGNSLLAYTGYKMLLGIVLLYVFCVSTSYHASLITLALRLDYSGVYLISLFPLMYFSPRWSESRMARWRLKQPAFTRILFSIFIILWFLLSIFIPSGNLGILTVVIIIVAVTVAFIIDKANHNKANLQYLILSIISVIIAALCFGIDKYEILCNPESYLQPHALWNLFIGIAALYFYYYMCSENKKELIVIN